jgi:hypothetical protein
LTQNKASRSIVHRLEIFYEGILPRRPGKTLGDPLRRQITLELREEIMKPYLLFPLATLAIGLAAPVLAQQEETIVDAQTIQQLHAIGSKSDEAFKKGDAAARAALFTEDAILLGPSGPIKGRQAIEKYYTDLFQKVHFIENVTKYDKDSPPPNRRLWQGCMGKRGMELYYPRPERRF